MQTLTLPLCTLVSKAKGFLCAGADLPTALARVSGAWLIAMPISACNLILVTAAEEKVLVGAPLFGPVLPLAARGAPLCSRLEATPAHSCTPERPGPPDLI